jgi:hypothetical protein
MSTPYQADPYQRGSGWSRSFLPLVLITLGVVFLLGNLMPERSRGGLIVGGLGAAFLVGRLTAGRYGYAVPAGILLAIGAYIGLQEMRILEAPRGPGLFFVLLGLGFYLVYLIGLRPAAVWPLFPATILVGLGLVLFGVGWLAPLAGLSWIVSLWPIVLVLLGVWLLFRDHLPLSARRPIATLGGLVLMAYGVLAAAATVAAGGILAQTGFAPGSGSSPFSDTVTLDAPITSGQTFSVNNSSGRTTIHTASGPNVHVVATKHYNLGGQAPDVRLTPGGSGVSLDVSNTTGRFPFGGSSSVDYAIEVPSAVAVKAQSGSGQLEIDGVSGAVQAETSSGTLNLTNLAGAVQARSGSGSVELNNIAGDVNVSTTSGQIRGTELQHVRQASTNSGFVSLEGVFKEQASVKASSGTVNVKLLPGSAVQLDVHTGSGSVVATGLFPSNGSTQPNSLSGAIGAPAPGATLSIETSSGSVLISQ